MNHKKKSDGLLCEKQKRSSYYGKQREDIQILENPLISGYGIEKMSNGRLYSANYQRYKNASKKKKANGYF